MFWSWRRESNPQPTDYKSVALPLCYASMMRQYLVMFRTIFRLTELVFYRSMATICLPLSKLIKKGCLVLTMGIEPIRPYGQRILSPLRLPVPPREHRMAVSSLPPWALPWFDTNSRYSFSGLVEYNQY